MAKADIHPKVLKLRFFGAWKAYLGEEPLAPLRSRKGDWLLALLAMRSDAVSRSWFAGTLWPESEESRALLYLRRELMYLRKALGHESDRLLSVGRALQLDLAGVDCDLLAFDAAIARGDEASLEVAVSLYTGSLLEGCDEEWVTAERTSRAQAYLSALERLAESALVRGDSSAAIRRLRAVVALDPLHESTQRTLMNTLADTGDSAAAIQVYRDLRLYLRRELNTETDPETTALFRRIRNRVHRSKQTASPASQTSCEPRLTRIPLPLSPLIGRHQELWEVRRRLGGSRLLTLTGTGGVGKTRLAIEVAEELKDDFAGGVCFVELAALSDVALVPQVVMNAFGLQQTPRRTALETLMDRLQSSELLLVLDNCEHLIQACAELVGPLLKSCANLHLLTTSREPLGITGESVWRVPSLSVPEWDENNRGKHKELIGEALEYDAITLFVERAQQVRADFSLKGDNVDVVSRVCRQLDGIPLAIELAAARVRSLSVEDIDSKLDQRFSLLIGGSRTALPRQQTLRALIDWSYYLLNEPEKALLGRLSVFAGGWTLEEAEQVCAGGSVAQSEILDLLTSLTDKSLVVAEIFSPSVRYRFLETIRQYASDHLSDSDDPETWRERHLAYFLAYAEQVEPYLSGAEQQRWMERLDSDHDNLRAALGWSLESVHEPESGLRLCSMLWWFWRVRGHETEGRQWCERALGGTDAQHGSKARADALHGAAVLTRVQGDYAAARALFEESLAIRRKIGDRKGIAYSVQGQGFVTSDQGDYATSRALLEESLPIHREIGDQWGVAVVLNRLGLVAHEQGDYSAAHALYEESLSIRREIGDQWGIANSLSALGVVAYDQSNYSAARALCEESVSIQRELGDQRGIALSLLNLGNVACKENDFADARAALLEGILLTRNTHDRKCTVEVLEAWGSLAATEAQWVRATLLLGAAEALREVIGSPLPPNEHPRYDALVAAIRVSLGGDTAFNSAWAEGRAMTMEQAVELAMQVTTD
ncbi:ATP-binding protein [Armatimonas sp.]|uniref:ATP-binding protein n=1 Tax=Armatimonas sp. TaxID=1872638 RepID=UPI00374CB344